MADDLQQGLGQVEGKLSKLIERMDQQDQKSDKSRGQVHKRLDSIETRFNHVETRSADMSEDIKAMKPAFEDFANWKQRLISMRTLIWLTASAIGAAGYAVAQWLAKAVKGLLGGEEVSQHNSYLLL
ncbi:MAG: DUF1515 family protein [Hyphomicrobiales bacterium]